MKTRIMKIFSIIMILILTACTGSQAPTSPTLLPTDTTLPLPTQTDTPIPSPTATSTPMPAPTSTPEPQTTFHSDLDQAVSALRHLDFDNMTDAQVEAMNKADETIEQAGAEGANRLKQELAIIQKTGEKDIPFQLDAAWLLWDIGGLDEVETIVNVWSGIPSKDWNYRMLFMPAFSAASTQDPRALPMLKILLANKDGSVYIDQHALTLDYPQTQEFLWGAYGSRGLPVLYEVLQTSKNPTEIETAIYLLASDQYLPALPEIRKAMDSQEPEVRNMAIWALGIFGHPDDYNRLVSGLKSTDPKLLYKYVYALNDFGDVRAVPLLIPLLQSTDEDLRMEVTFGLGDYLASPEGLAALNEAAETTTDQKWADLYKRYVQNVLDSANLTWDAFKSLPVKERQKVTENYRFADITLKEGEKAITHDQLLEVVAEWRETGGITSEKWSWVETRHILPAATADDINLILDAKAKIYLRLSDECMDELKIVDDLVKWIGRSRYR